MKTARALTERARFERRREIVDAEGTPRGQWDVMPGLDSVPVGYRPEFAGEALKAGRDESAIRGTVEIRSFGASRAITAMDRIVFTAGPYAGMVGNIRSVRPMPGRATIEMTIEIGGV